MVRALPEGVLLRPLLPHLDSRGVFTEVFRQSWLDQAPPVQWNAVSSEANVLRGVHVHLKHFDYLIVIQGQALFGLKDLRCESPTAGQTCMLEMTGEAPAALFIPPGVAHGFYFRSPAIHFYAVSTYWDLADELGCRFDSPGLNMDWPCHEPVLSERDADLGTLDDLLTKLRGAGV